VAAGAVRAEGPASVGDEHVVVLLLGAPLVERRGEYVAVLLAAAGVDLARSGADDGVVADVSARTRRRIVEVRARAVADDEVVLPSDRRTGIVGVSNDVLQARASATRTDRPPLVFKFLNPVTRPYRLAAATGGRSSSAAATLRASDARAVSVRQRFVYAAALTKNGCVDVVHTTPPYANSDAEPATVLA
jgi:hypothetical protein